MAVVKVPGGVPRKVPRVTKDMFQKDLQKKCSKEFQKVSGKENLKTCFEELAEIFLDWTNKVTNNENDVI